MDFDIKIISRLEGFVPRVYLLLSKFPVAKRMI